MLSTKHDLTCVSVVHKNVRSSSGTCDYSRASRRNRVLPHSFHRFRGIDCFGPLSQNVSTKHIYNFLFLGLYATQLDSAPCIFPFTHTYVKPYILNVPLYLLWPFLWPTLSQISLYTYFTSVLPNFISCHYFFSQHVQAVSMYSLPVSRPCPLLLNYFL